MKKAIATKRTKQIRTNAGTAMQKSVGEYVPSMPVSKGAYAVLVPNDAMRNATDPERSLTRGDWCVIDPAEQPRGGDIVHAVDPHTGEHVLRFFVPLHPSNPRAPGAILRAADRAFDDIFVGPGVDCIKGPIVEKRTLMASKRP